MARDWVVNTRTWFGNTLQGALWGSLGTLDIAGEFAVFPLTITRRDPSNAQEVALPEIAQGMRAVRTMGYVHWHLESGADAPLSDVYTPSWRATCAMRITRFPQDVNGESIIPVTGYDLTDTEAANDQFVWHWEKALVNQSANDWLGTSGSKAPLAGTTRVNVSYQRRIEELECMSFHIQFQQGNLPGNAPWEDASGRVFLNYQIHLRTFVETM